jgi:hypothetical protein
MTTARGFHAMPESEMVESIVLTSKGWEERDRRARIEARAWDLFMTTKPAFAGKSMEDCIAWAIKWDNLCDDMI